MEYCFSLKCLLGYMQQWRRMMGKDGATIKFSMEALLTLTFQEPYLLDGVCHRIRKSAGCSSVATCRQLNDVDRWRLRRDRLGSRGAGGGKLKVYLSNSLSRSGLLESCPVRAYKMPKKQKQTNTTHTTHPGKLSERSLKMTDLCVSTWQRLLTRSLERIKWFVKIWL